MKPETDKDLEYSFRHLFKENGPNKRVFVIIKRTCTYCFMVTAARPPSQAAALIREDDEAVCAGTPGIRRRPEIADNGYFPKRIFRFDRRPNKLPYGSDND